MSSLLLGWLALNEDDMVPDIELFSVSLFFGWVGVVLPKIQYVTLVRQMEFMPNIVITAPLQFDTISLLSDG